MCFELGHCAALLLHWLIKEKGCRELAKQQSGVLYVEKISETSDWK